MKAKPTLDHRYFLNSHSLQRNFTSVNPRSHSQSLLRGAVDYLSYSLPSLPSSSKVQRSRVLPAHCHTINRETSVKGIAILAVPQLAKNPRSLQEVRTCVSSTCLPMRPTSYLTSPKPDFKSMEASHISIARYRLRTDRLAKSLVSWRVTHTRPPMYPRLWNHTHRWFNEFSSQLRRCA